MSERMMLGRNGDGTPFPDGYHGGEHPYDRACDEYPACVDADPDYFRKEQDSVKGFVTKDSGERQDYPSGMRRDLQDGKARFDLIFPDGVPYPDQLLTRFAELLERGAAKYGENNWQLANSEEELKRFRASGLRHMIQWSCGETDEDHATAVIFNLMAYENTKRKLEQGDE